jgi:CheY-like chemotaxis protein
MEHILIVDDAEPIAYAFQRYFENYGYRVTVAYDAPTALEKGSKEFLDGIITDFRMPEMNGEELIARLRQIMPDIPAILVSAYANEIGAIDHCTRIVNKPIDPAILLKTMSEMLMEAKANKKLR